MSKVFAIYPIDKGLSSSTKFLNRINTYEMRMLGENWHCYKIHFSDKDHENCIKASKDSHFILFMGHGGESKLCGACGKNGEMPADPLVRVENSDYYIKEGFIDTNNISEFKDKIFFCFSCDSNRNTPRSLGRKAIECGVLSFVGFGNIPTDYVDSRGLPKRLIFSKRCIAIYKGIIIKVMKHAIQLSAESCCSVDAIVRIIRILTTKEIRRLAEPTNKIRQKELIIKQLVLFKNEIRIFGDRYARI